MKRKENLLGVLTYLKAYKLPLCFALGCAVIGTVFSVLTPKIMGNITTELYAGVTTGIFNWINIVILLGVLIMFYVIGQLFGFFQSYGMTKISARVMEQLRNEIAEKMNRLKLSYYDTKTKGEILSVLTNDIDVITNVISQNLTQIVTQLITVVGILAMMLQISRTLSIIAIVMVPVSILASAGVMKASAKHFSRQQACIGRLNGFIEEIYQGQLVVQSFHYEDRAREQFAVLNQELEDSARNAEAFSGMIMPITGVVNNIGYVISAVIGCFSVLSGNMTVGNVQAMLQYTKQFSQPFTSIAGMAGNLGAANAAAKRIFALLQEEEETPDAEESQTAAFDKGEVTFSNVSFGYTKDRTLMKNVSFHVSPGQKVAIVGPTGAGKTTLINLLMRFYEIDGGEILLNGVNTGSMSRHELRKHFGMVLQDTWLFEGSIHDNIAYAKEGLSEEKIINAAKAAGAHGFIRTLPGGYDLELAAGAENISQGEKQLLTIARAFASDPEIMILDEATSNVDTHTEKQIQEAMSRLMKGRTSFVIAHRLATIKDADMILYMEQGDILEMGTHEELLKLNRKYATLYNSQFVS